MAATRLSCGMVTRLCKEMNVHLGRPQGLKATEADIAYIRETHGVLTGREVGEKLGYTEHYIRNLRRKLKLPKLGFRWGIVPGQRWELPDGVVLEILKVDGMTVKYNAVRASRTVLIRSLTNRLRVSGAKNAGEQRPPAE
jgi:hypothetical protein